MFGSIELENGEVFGRPIDQALAEQRNAATLVDAVELRFSF